MQKRTVRRFHRYPRYLAQFLNALLEESRELTTNIPQDQWREMEKSMLETIATPEGKIPNPNRRLSQRQIFFRQLMFDFTELFSSYEVLADFPALSRTRWPRNSTLTPSKVILFWRETHLNECYIFHCRFQSFLARVQRSYRKDRRFAGLIEAIPKLQHAIKEDFATLEGLRGEHVHQHRYRHRDAEINRLELLELLVVSGGMKGLQVVYRLAVSAAKRNTIKKFNTFNRRATRDLNSVLRLLCQILLSDGKRLIYPNQLKGEDRLDTDVGSKTDGRISQRT